MYLGTPNEPCNSTQIVAILWTLLTAFVELLLTMHTSKFESWPFESKSTTHHSQVRNKIFGLVSKSHGRDSITRHLNSITK